MERFDLRGVHEGETLKVVTEENQFEFHVLNVNPLLCSMSRIDENGRVAGPLDVVLHGSGKWINNVNSVNEQGPDRRITPSLRPGFYLAVAEPKPESIEFFIEQEIKEVSRLA